MILVGRLYKRLLERDPKQVRAFLNWGRAVCLRGELAREVGNEQAAAALFKNAANKFNAVLELDSNNAEAVRFLRSLQ